MLKRKLTAIIFAATLSAFAALVPVLAQDSGQSMQSMSGSQMKGDKMKDDKMMKDNKLSSKSSKHRKHRKHKTVDKMTGNKM